MKSKGKQKPRKPVGGCVCDQRGETGSEGGRLRRATEGNSQAGWLITQLSGLHSTEKMEGAAMWAYIGTKGEISTGTRDVHRPLMSSTKIQPLY